MSFFVHPHQTDTYLTFLVVIIAKEVKIVKGVISCDVSPACGDVYVIG